MAALALMVVGFLAPMVGPTACAECDPCYAVIRLTNAGTVMTTDSQGNDREREISGTYVWGSMWPPADASHPAPQYYWVEDPSDSCIDISQPGHDLELQIWRAADWLNPCEPRRKGDAWIIGLTWKWLYFQWFDPADYSEGEGPPELPPTSGWLAYPPVNGACPPASPPEDFKLEFLCEDCETPVLSGAPTETVVVQEGQYYEFTPEVVSGDPHRFTCPGCPGWLPCDETSGLISGTPPEGSAGDYSIQILVQAKNGCVGELDPFMIEVIDEPDPPDDEGKSEEDEAEDFPGYDFEIEWDGDEEDPWDPDTGLDPEFSNITWLTRFWVYVMRGVPDLRVWPPLFCWPPPDALLDALIEISSLPAVFGDLTVAFNDIEKLNLVLGLQLSGAGPENALVTILDTSTGDAQRMYCLAPDDEVDLFRVFLDRNAHALLSVPEVVLQGEEIRLEFALTGLLTGSRVHDPTANLALVRHEDAGGFAFVSWNLIGFDEATQRYFHSIDTSTLAPGTYDLYVGTSQDWMSRRIRIEIEGP